MGSIGNRRHLDASWLLPHGLGKPMNGQWRHTWGCHHIATPAHMPWHWHRPSRVLSTRGQGCGARGLHGRGHGTGGRGPAWPRAWYRGGGMGPAWLPPAGSASAASAARASGCTAHSGGTGTPRGCRAPGQGALGTSARPNRPCLTMPPPPVAPLQPPLLLPFLQAASCCEIPSAIGLEYNCQTLHTHTHTSQPHLKTPISDAPPPRTFTQ